MHDPSAYLLESMSEMCAMLKDLLIILLVSQPALERRAPHLNAFLPLPAGSTLDGITSLAPAVIPVGIGFALVKLSHRLVRVAPPAQLHVDL